MREDRFVFHTEAFYEGTILATFPRFDDFQTTLHTPNDTKRAYSSTSLPFSVSLL